MTKLAKREILQSSKRILLNEHQYSGSGLDSYSVGFLDLAGKTEKKLLQCWMFSLEDWRIHLQLESPPWRPKNKYVAFFEQQNSIFYNFWSFLDQESDSPKGLDQNPDLMNPKH
jgi:hypothetical protein